MSRYKIAITGGIGSGKSTACRIVAERGFPVYSCDVIYQELYQTEEYQNELLSLFPACESDGKADRKKLAKIVFSDASALKKLNEFSHGEIMARLFSLMEKENFILSFAEVPLLFEGGYEKDFDFVIVIERNKALRVAATMQRDGISQEEVLQRMGNQWDYCSAAHQKMMKDKKFFTIKNDGDENQLKLSINAILQSVPTCTI